MVDCTGEILDILPLTIALVTKVIFGRFAGVGAAQAGDRANQVGDGVDDFIGVAEERGDYENPDEGIGGIEGEVGGGEGEIDRLAGLGSLGGLGGLGVSGIHHVCVTC